MICPFCHQETGDGNFFCSRCGADLRKASKPVTLDAAPGPADQGASPGEEPKTGQKPKSRICAWVVLGVVVLASAVLVIKMVMAEGDLILNPEVRRNQTVDRELDKFL